MEISIEVQDEQEAQAVRLVIAERRRQDDLFGKQDHDLAWWMTIMGEEFGETCQAVCEYRWAEANPELASRMARVQHAVAEASQVSAVAVAMIQSILRNEWTDEISTVLPSDKRKVAKTLNRGDESLRYDDDDEGFEEWLEPGDDSLPYRASFDGAMAAGVTKEAARKMLQSILERRKDAGAEKPPSLKCYHCSLDIKEDPDGGYQHDSVIDYMKWLESLPHDRGDHLARYEPDCTICGRDNANGTHSALERTGHLGHRFTLTKQVEAGNIDSSEHVGGIAHGGF